MKGKRHGQGLPSFALKTCLQSSQGPKKYIIALFTSVILIAAASNARFKASASGSTAPIYGRFLVLVPFTSSDVDSLSKNLEQWTRLGPACTESFRDGNMAELWFYYSRGLNDLPADFIALQRGPTYYLLSECFSRVRVVSANLTDAEDEYPAGINFMFYRVMTGLSYERELADFAALYWMEPDVVPIKPRWLNAIIDEASLTAPREDYWWVKGSIYMGDMFDAALARDLGWVRHINGNAIYRLHDPQFIKFLQVVMDLEPPGHFWKPFDVSMSKVLHDFPYFWHAHQRIVRRFVYSDFVNHWGDSLTEDAMQLSLANPRTVLVHGRKTPPGTSSKFEDKVKARGARRGVNWDGSLDISDSVSTMIRADRDSIDYISLAVTSIMRHMPGALEIVVIVPNVDRALFAARLAQLTRASSDKLKLVVERPLSSEMRHVMQGAYTRLMADLYCSGRFIFQMDPASVLIRKIYRKDLFWAGKPILWYTSVEEAPRSARVWLEGVVSALGLGGKSDLLNLSARVRERVVAHEDYSAIRKHIERVHQGSFKSFMQSRHMYDHCSKRTNKRLEVRSDSCDFSDSVVLGAFLLVNTSSSKTSAMPLRGSREYVRETFVPIVPSFTCGGHARIAEILGQRSNDLRALESAMRGEDECARLHGWVQAGKGHVTIRT